MTLGALPGVAGPELIVVGYSPTLIGELLTELGGESSSVRSCQSSIELSSMLGERAAELVLWRIGDAESGITACQRLRSTGVRVPMVCVVPRIDKELERLLLEAGANHVVEESAPDLLRAAVFSLVRRGRREYRVDLDEGVAFDCVRGAITTGRTETVLTPAILELFQVLALAFGDWVSIQSVAEHLGLAASAKHSVAFVKQRAQALRRVLARSELTVTFSVASGVRLTRRA
jgi:DNA-binding response OmpR family regulator